MPTDFLYHKHRRWIDTQKMYTGERPYRDHLNSRFAYFQSRIGLPEDHQYTKGEIHLGAGIHPAASE